MEIQLSGPAGQKILYKRPWLYPKQENAVFSDARYSVIEASTKSGKTVACIVWLFEKALLGEDGQNFWWVAPIYKQANIAFRRMVKSVPRNLIRYNLNDLRIDIVPSGTSIWFMSAENPDSLYGEDVYACVIDEATRCKEESWFAVRSTLTATRGPIRIIGNVKGKANWAYKLALIAKTDDDSNYEHHKITAYDAVEAGVLEAEEIEDAKRIYPDWMFKELYLAEPADDGGNPFGIDAIQKCIQRTPDGKERTKPQASDPVVWGWDVAKALNYTVGIALDKDGNVCRLERFKTNWELTVKRIVRLTGGLTALVDSTGVGDQVLERLKAEGGLNFRGFKFTVHSKQELMVGLAAAIQHEEITFPAGPIVDELEIFEYEIRGDRVLYRAPEGYHDDCVDALALAVKLWRKDAVRLGPFSLSSGLTTSSYWKS